MAREFTPAELAAYMELRPVRRVTTYGEPIARDPLAELEVGWEAYELCPLEHQGDPDRRGGLVIGKDDELVVVMRHRTIAGRVTVRQQTFPLAALDPERVVEPDRRYCHKNARIILKALAAGKGSIDDDDRLWLEVARRLAAV